MKKLIEFKDLPAYAQDGFSEDQISYIDEFKFYLYENGNIEAEYANDLIATWDGNEWRSFFNAELSFLCNGNRGI